MFDILYGMANHAVATGIGQLNEGHLHASLKKELARPGDLFETNVEDYVIDIVRGDVLIEIQTGNFSKLKRKLQKLVAQHKVHLVYPIPVEKWVVRKPRVFSSKGSRRKSPKRGRITDLFLELVSFPQLIRVPNFSLEVLLIQEEEVRRFKGKRHWRRRGWKSEERRLLHVLSSHIFIEPADFLSLVPEDTPAQFTTSDLAAGLGQPRWLAQKMAYCLREMHAIEKIGTKNRSNLYQVRK